MSTERVYKVRVAGLVPLDELREELEEFQVDAHRLRTVLIGRFADRAALAAFLRQLRDRGLEIVEVRRLPGFKVVADHLGRETVTPERSSGEGSAYELTLAGEPVPALKRLIEPYAVALSELYTVLRAKVPADIGLVDLVLQVESRGFKIASIAALDAGLGMPGQRGAAETAPAVRSPARQPVAAE
ncbi:MAG TPA: hypothetical protein VFG72_04085 [Marmoricola sp.]|nr:hypothetical protein [Marmoricola sp.]